MKINDAKKLFFKKEGKELLGKGYKNAMILMGIFLISLFAIGFGSASMSYLKYKMEDPFINWIDIPKQEIYIKDPISIEQFINDTTAQNRYKFNNPEKNYVLSNYFRDVNNKDIQFAGRSISANSSVMDKILSKENIVQKRELSFNDSELGFIFTEAGLLKLGYNSNNLPSFITLSTPYDSTTCSKLNIADNINGYYPVNVPIFAVVKQLPGMYSFLFTERFLKEVYSNDPIDITSEENNKSLNICGKYSDLEIIKAKINQDSFATEISSIKKTWNADIYQLTITGRETGDYYISKYNTLANTIINKYSNIYRYYDFINKYSNEITTEPSYYSVQMISLDSITSFNKELFDECGVNIEMTSIATKENFRVVQRMGTILSWAIIILAAVFICVFIYYLLTSHFQKIKPNLGTFKAFGISNKMLTSIYVSALFTITSLSFVVSFAISFILTNIISLFSTIDANFVWIDIMVIENLYLLLIVLFAAVIITFWVTKKIFQETPGDLIYNRN